MYKVCQEDVELRDDDNLCACFMCEKTWLVSIVLDINLEFIHQAKKIGGIVKNGTPHPISILLKHLANCRGKNYSP
jgi:hypothetical protein